MPNDKVLRQQSIDLLTAGEAHASFDAAVKDMPVTLRGTRPKGSPASPWEVLEHMRIAQWDILEFTRNPAHVSPEFPSGYWPTAAAPPNEKAWDKSADAFRADLKAMCDLVRDESTDLFADLPHAQGKTVLREVLLTADHNAYHLGQLIALRRALGAWAAS